MRRLGSGYIMWLTAALVIAASAGAEAQECPKVYHVGTTFGCRWAPAGAYEASLCCEDRAYYCGTGKAAGEPTCRDDGNPATFCGDFSPYCVNRDTSATACVPPGPLPTCNSGEDPLCTGLVNPNCSTCKDEFAGGSQASCGGDPGHTQAGDDPILIGSRAAVTEPYTDFSVERISRLSLTRTYNSSDLDLKVGGTGGIFANAWHHDWEAHLTCTGDICTVARGTLSGFKFALSGTALSPDGSETWNVYGAYAPFPYKTPHRNVLVERPSGEWIVFLTDGRELHFAQACSPCDGGSSPYCTAASSGGRARLTKVVDLAGNAVTVSYQPENGVLLRLTDDLGHSLEARNPVACPGPRYAKELRYDGVTVATYTYAGNLLASAVDADAKTLRSYVHQNVAGHPWPRVSGVRDESGTLIAEFSYDPQGRAIGVVDGRSSVGVAYSADGLLVTMTEYFRGPNGETAITSSRTLDYFGRVVAMTGPSSMGAGGALQWTEDGRLQCSVSDEGQVKFQEYDAAGRVIHTVEYAGQGCSVPDPLPADAREEWREYGVAKTVAPGVTLGLDTVTKIFRRSGVNPSGYSWEEYDHDAAPALGDPAGYTCHQAPLPEGSVMCRQISAGYVDGSSGAVLERHATFFSYDARGRLVRTYGPIDLDHPGANDVPPLEERVYWGDGESSARQGRLRELRVYASPSAAPLVTSYDYDLFGVFLTVAPDGTATTIVKDGRGRPIHVIVTGRGGSASHREIRYHDGMKPRLRIFGTGASERYSYDSKGRLDKVERLAGDPEAPGANVAAASTELYVYDQAGNQIHSERRDAEGVVRWAQDRAYDHMHNVVWQSHPNQPGAARTWTYDTDGSLHASEDEEGRETSFTFDGLRRATGVRRAGVDSSGSPLAVDVADYDFVPNRDELARVADGTGRATSYTYDDFGRLQRLSSPNLRWGGDRWFRYDARGNLVAKGDSEDSVAYTYDGLDRLLTLAADRTTDGSSVQYEYRYDENGEVGRLTTIAGTETTLAYAYDGFGRVASLALSQAGVAAPFVTEYSYDADGDVASVTYPSGLVVAYDRDPATREIVRVRNAADEAVFVSNVARLPGGPVSALTFGNGTALAQTFNLRYEPQAIASGPLSLSYLMSPAGDVVQATDRSEDPVGCTRDVSRVLSYDLLDRLASWSDTRNDPGACPPTVLGALGALYEYAPGTDAIAKQLTGTGAASLAFGYDHQGNVSAIGRYDASGANIERAVCLRHDVLGRLTMVGDMAGALTPGGVACLEDVDVSAVSARFRYDAHNRRVARQLGSGWQYIVPGMGGEPLTEMAAGESGQPLRVVRDYVWMDGVLVAQIEYGIAGSTSRPYAVHVDHLGTPRALTSAEGEQVWGTYQRPFGEVGEIVSADPVTAQQVVTNLRLPGQYDERLFGSLGLQGPYYNWNRWYLPGVGRYLEADPLALFGMFSGEYGPDWYNYANGNPLRYIDPTGLAFQGGGRTPANGGGRDSCSFYNDECYEKNYQCPRDKDPYPCQAERCCRKFDESDRARCTRVCLIEEEKDCALLGKGRWSCRMKAHYKCYRICGFNGSGANVSWSCLRTGLSF